MSLKDNWMAAFQPQTPNALYDKPLTYSLGEFGTEAGGHRIGRVDATGDSTAQFTRAVALGFNYVILFNTDQIAFGDVQRIVTKAHGYGLGVIALNPVKTIKPHAYVAHPNVVGVIVEQGNGVPADHQDWRKLSYKDGIMPMWFVFADKAAAQQCVAQIQQGRYRGMGVVYAAGPDTVARENMLLPAV